MKGYKGMGDNMQCRGMQFEVGKSYHVDGQIKPCSNGLHFCEKLKDVFDYYKRDGNRFFEIEASGDIRAEGNKKVASDIRIVKELGNVEINRTVYDDGNGNDDGYRDGNGYGDGCGDGYGNGYGCGDGYGCGYGNIQKILSFI